MYVNEMNDDLNKNHGYEELPTCSDTLSVRNEHTSPCNRKELVLANEAAKGTHHLANGYHFDEDFDEEVDEVFSDADDFDDITGEPSQNGVPTRPGSSDVTNQLLSFAEMVNHDIQKFFGRNKGNDDHCDVYEDKWTSGKSGRELYYMDLLKIAQGGDTDEPFSKAKNKVEKKDNNHNLASASTSNPRDMTGKLNRTAGVGPLAELFEYGLQNVLPKLNLPTKKIKRLKINMNKFDSVLPMSKRELPASFWKEPGNNKPKKVKESEKLNGLIPSNKLPDFSDLLESWYTDEEGNNTNCAT